MIRLFAVLAAGTALAACATAEAPPVAPAAPAPIVAPAEPIPPSPRAHFGSFGFDLQGMDRSIQPGNDFYQYSNGTWARTTPIPADKSNYGMFTLLDDLSKQRTREIIDEQAKQPNSKIARPTRPSSTLPRSRPRASRRSSPG